jgi:hypothetical protein
LNSEGELVSVFDKSKKLVGESKLSGKLQRIYEIRRQKVLQYMVETKKITPGRFRVVPPKEAVDVPYESLSRLAANYFVSEE